MQYSIMADPGDGDCQGCLETDARMLHRAVLYMSHKGRKDSLGRTEKCSLPPNAISQIDFKGLVFGSWPSGRYDEDEPNTDKMVAIYDPKDSDLVHGRDEGASERVPMLISHAQIDVSGNTREMFMILHDCPWPWART